MNKKGRKIFFLVMLGITMFLTKMPIVFADDDYSRNFLNCNNPEFEKAMIFLGKLIMYARIVIPVMIVVIAFYTFSKAVLSQDDKVIHTALITMIRKIAIAVAIFVIPFFLIKVLVFGLGTMFNINDSQYKCITYLDDPENHRIRDSHECVEGWLGDINKAPLRDGSTRADGTRYGSPAFYLNQVMNLMKFLGIILCIVLSVYDFAKVLTNPDKDAYTKALSGTMKRLAYAVVIFILPIVVKEILLLLNIVSLCSGIGEMG